MKHLQLAIGLTLGLSAVLCGCRPSTPGATGSGEPAANSTTPKASATSSSAAAIADSAPQAPKGAPNLLIITVDTLRADNLGCYGYFRDTSPNIDALAKEAVLFENCYTPVGQTLPSHTSLFTGVYPREHGVRTNFFRLDDSQMAALDGVYGPSTKILSLASALRAEGYNTAGFVSAEPVKTPGGLSAGFDHWYEPAEDKVTCDVTNKEVFAWLDKKPKEPFFVWIHYFDPHGPYQPPAPYDTQYQTDDELEKFRDERGFEDKGSKIRREPENQKVKDARKEINRYNGEIAYTDKNIGELFKELQTRGLWKDMAVVFTADHGEALGQHGCSGHGDIWLEHLHIPCIMKAPGQSPRKESAPMTIVDVVPTLAALSPGLPLAKFLKQCTGGNALAQYFTPRPIYGEMPSTRKADVTAIIVGDWRYVEDPQFGRHLFNLREDPYELKNVVDEHKDVADRMAEQLKQIVAVQQSKGEELGAGELIKKISATDGGKDHRTKALEAMGYTEDDGEDEGAATRSGHKSDDEGAPATSSKRGGNKGDNDNK